MKRMYIAVALIIISLTIGVTEMYTVKNTVKECISGLKSVNESIYSGNIKTAIKKCDNIAKKFEDKSDNILYCYYNHKELDSINENIVTLREYLKYNKKSDYYAVLAIIKKQLKSMEDEEIPKLQNIL